MITVGITGGIGSGKSSVCKIWKKLGACVLNADDLAKEIMVSNPEVRQQLYEAFGAKTFTSDGTLNREFLAQEAFGKGRVQELNAIIHPKLPAATEQKIKEARQQHYHVFVYEAALLLETENRNKLDYLVLVVADEQRRIQRVQKRDLTNKGAIEQRMAQQQNFEEARDKVDYIIYNNGSLDELQKKTEHLFEELNPNYP